MESSLGKTSQRTFASVIQPALRTCVEPILTGDPLVREDRVAQN